MNDIFKAIRPLSFLCRLSGMTPGYQRIEEGKVASYVSIIHTCLIIAIIIIGTIIYIPDQIYKQMKHDSRDFGVGQYTALLWYSMSLLIGVSCYCLTISRRAMHNKMMQTLAEIDRDIEVINVQESLLRTQSVCSVCATVSILQISGLVYISVTDPYGEMATTGWKMLTVYILSVVSVIVINSQFFVFAHALLQRVDIMRKRFQAMVWDWDWFSPLNAQDEPSELASVVRKLAMRRVKMLSLVKTINSTFGDFFFFETCYTTLIMAINLEMMVYAYFRRLKGVLLYLIIDFALWSGSYAVGTAAILVISEIVLRSDEKSRALAMELLLKTRDRKARQELRTLITQMHHGRIYFSACGVFRLDYSVIKSMVTGVITYLVILLQFMPAKEKSLEDQDNG